MPLSTIFQLYLLPGSFAWWANFLRAAAKLEVLVAFRAALELTEFNPLLEEVWLSGGTVAVFRGNFEPPNMFSGGGLTFCPVPKNTEAINCLLTIWY